MELFSAKQAVDYVEELRRDGWDGKHTFNENDPVFSAAKEDFKMSVVCREYPNAISPVCFSSGILGRVCAWGPDSIAIQPPLPYDWEKVKEGIYICGFCGEKADKTVRVAFANRSCEACAPAARKKLEKPGWCD